MKEIHLTKRINACDLHLKRNEFDSFVKAVITGDEKWIVYNNVVRKRSWSKPDEPPQTISKAELHKKKLSCLFGGIEKLWYYISFPFQKI